MIQKKVLFILALIDLFLVPDVFEYIVFSDNCGATYRQSIVANSSIESGNYTIAVVVTDLSGNEYIY